MAAWRWWNGNGWRGAANVLKHKFNKENEEHMKKNRWFIWLSLLVSLGLVLAACGAPPAPPPPTAAPNQATPAAPAQTQAAPAAAPAQPTPTLPPAQPMPAAPALGGTSWTLASIEALGASTGTLPGADITLDFSADGQANGAAGCNTYNGTYTLTGDTLTFGPLITTRMMCPEPIMKQEQAYLAMLSNPSTVKLETNSLTLTFDGG